MTSNVIEEVRGKCREFSEDSCYLYRFVTRPGPFNFVGDENSTPQSTPNARRVAATTPSSLGKRKREEKMSSDDYDGTWFANDYASTSADEESFVTDRDSLVCTPENSQMVLGTPVQKRSRRSCSASYRSSNSHSSSSILSDVNSAGKRANSRRGRGTRRSQVLVRGSGMQDCEPPPHALVAKVWKELTLNRYVRMS